MHAFTAVGEEYSFWVVFTVKKDQTAKALTFGAGGRLRWSVMLPPAK